MANVILRGFSQLTRFRGRDTRGEFWPYCGVVIALYMVAGMASILPLMAQIVVARTLAVAQGAVTAFLVTSLCLFIAVVALLAAAVARRLHDNGRTAFWGLLPTPFIVYSELMFFRVFGRFPSATPEMPLFLSVFASNAIYLLAVGVLIVLLSLPGTSQPNRFG